MRRLHKQPGTAGPTQGGANPPIRPPFALRRKLGRLLSVASLLLLASCAREREKETGAGVSESPYSVIPGAEFVGHQACRECHETEFRDWRDSDHHRSMNPATEEHVLGDFDDAVFEHFGQRFHFFRRDGAYWVNAPDETGAARDMRIEYTFGHDPLQQYLIAFPGGRYQALQVCWDSRPAEEGGQRWFHLYPDEPVPPEDVLHWTRRHFNWNYMCADCHSTHVDKGFDSETLSYHTTWSEMSVSCEACHGPASEHLAWARAWKAREAGAASLEEADLTRLREYVRSKGFPVSLREPGDEAGEFPWTIDPASGRPHRVRPLSSSVQVESCAPCHSHRLLLEPKWRPGQPYHDSHIPSVLSERLYHHDGQLKEETYVYGSFVQSKMYHAGVRCTDCHHPHTMKLVAPGNALCVRCHQADRYDAPSHHFHPVGSPGASCVECHMPETLYMGVDARRDHSLRVPRPDLAQKLGSPDACSRCHQEQGTEWAAEKFRECWGSGPRNLHYGEILAAARREEPGSAPRLLALATDLSTPGLARAAAVEIAGQWGPSAELSRLLAGRLADPDPSVRREALAALQGYPPGQRLALGRSALEDPVRAVRSEAARVLAAAHAEFDEATARAFERAAAEFHAQQEAIADRGAGPLGLAAFYADLGDRAQAEAAYQLAQKVEPEFIPARLNYADWLEQLQRLEEAEAEFRGALVAARGDADRGLCHEALARYLVRRQRYEEGLAELAAAARLLPEQAETQFFYGVALNSLGRFAEALPHLEKAHQLAPRHLEYLTGLATICRDAGRLDLARQYARRALELQPDHPQLQALLRSLGAK